MTLNLKLNNFSGEPKLLLQEVKEEKLDICNFSLIEIVDQYLDWLLDFQGNIDIAADFLLISSSLIFLKSVSLLPKKEIIQEEDESGFQEILERSIYEYEQIRNVAKELRAKEEERALFFSRPRMRVKQDIEQGNTKQQKADIKTLITAFAQISSFISNKEIELVKERWSVRDKILQILNWLKNKSLISLRKLFQSTEDRIEMITIFLATLELIKTDRITVRQDELFGEIWIHPVK